MPPSSSEAKSLPVVLTKEHINEDVRPVQQKPTQVPFNVRKDTDKELDRLLDLDIIEPAESASTNKVINTTIQREHHPNLKTDKLIADMMRSLLRRQKITACESLSMPQTH